MICFALSFGIVEMFLVFIVVCFNWLYLGANLQPFFIPASVFFSKFFDISDNLLIFTKKKFALFQPCVVPFAQIQPQLGGFRLHHPYVRPRVGVDFLVAIVTQRHTVAAVVP